MPFFFTFHFFPQHTRGCENKRVLGSSLSAKESDAFIAMPGGFGTLEELLEVITWQQLGYHSKPIGCLNVGGYYDKFLEFIDFSVESGFISSVARKIIVTASTPEELLDKMEKFEVAESRIVAASGGARS